MRRRFLESAANCTMLCWLPYYLVQLHCEWSLFNQRLEFASHLLLTARSLLDFFNFIWISRRERQLRFLISVLKSGWKSLNCNWTLAVKLGEWKVFTIPCSKRNNDDNDMQNDRNFKLFTIWTDGFLSIKMNKLRRFQILNEIRRKVKMTQMDYIR